MEPQEIRNALFQGYATEFLQKCAQLQCFLTATGGSVKSERMLDREFVFVMESIYKIMGRDAFRKICGDGRRRPINKVIFESWCYVVKNLTPHDTDILIQNKARVKERYMELCELPQYLYVLKAPDKKAVYARIDYINSLVLGIIKEFGHD